MAVTASADTFFATSLYWWNCVRTVRISAEICGVTSAAGGSVRTTAWRQSRVSVYFTTAARSSPSTRSRILPSGIFVICSTRAIVPTLCTSCSPGSSTAVFFCAARNKGRPRRAASSTLFTDRRRPTKKGTTMRGNTTRSLRGTTKSSCFFCNILMREAWLRARSRTSCTRSPSTSCLRRLLLAGQDDLGPLGARDHALRDDHFLRSLDGGDVEHDVHHERFHDGAKAPRARLALDRLPGNAIDGAFLELQLHVVELEGGLVLLQNGVVRFGDDAAQRQVVQLFKGDHDGKPAHELGNETVADEIVRLQLGIQGQEVLLTGALGVRAETHGVRDRPLFHDAVEADEGSSADEEDVRRVDAQHFLVGMLAASLGRHGRHRAFHDLQQRLLHALARHVAGDGRVVAALARDLVDFVDINDAAFGGGDVVAGVLDQLQEDVLHVLPDVTGLGQGGRVRDGEGHLQLARQRPGQEGLPGPRGADEQDVGLLQLHLVLHLVAEGDPLVVVVDRDGEHFFGLLLGDDVLVQVILDLPRLGDVLRELDGEVFFLLVQDLLADVHALVADENSRAGNQPAGDIRALAAEGTDLEPVTFE